MENKDLPLEQAVALYSEAARLTEVCKNELNSAKLEIEKIENSKAV